MQIVDCFLLHRDYIFQFINSLFQSISVIFSFFLHDFLAIGERLNDILLLLKQFTLQLIDGAVDEKSMVFQAGAICKTNLFHIDSVRW